MLGAGAVGGITAALMKKNGYDVEIICKYDEYASLISNYGLNVRGTCGSFSVKLPAYSSAKLLNSKKDVILHATKSTDLVDAVVDSAFLLKDDGCFVSMQNGIVEDELITVARGKKVIGCVTGWGATMESQGNLVMTSAGDFILGYPGKPPDSYLSLVAEALSSVVPVRMTDNIMGHLYSKLIINSCITSLGAICGLYLGKMLSVAKIRRIFIEIIRESVAVADSMKIRIEVFGGVLDFRKFIERSDPVSDFRRHLMIRLIGFKYRRLKSSSLQSLERGKPSEIDFLNGYIVRNAEKHNIKVPVNKAVVQKIHEIEAQKRIISAENFNDPEFDRFN